MLTADDARLYRSCVGAFMYFVLGAQNAYVKLRIQSDDPITVELVGYSDSDWAGDPSSRKSQSSGHVEADGWPTDVLFSKTELCGNEQRDGRVLRDVLDCGGTVTLENDSGALWIQSERDPLLRLSGCARHCAESWIARKSRRWR